MTNIHHENHPCFVHTFLTQKELNEWQEQFEETYEVKFRYWKNNNHISHKTIYKRCNRSPKFIKKSVSTGQRAAKVQSRNGPSQISKECTATLTVIEKEGCFKVTAYPTHANHTLDNHHKKTLRLPKSIQNEYITKLSHGVHISVILRGINLKVKEQYPQRKGDLSIDQAKVSYDTLYYLKRKYLKETLQRHPDDLQAIKIMSQECPNDIIYTKFQKTVDDQYCVIITFI